jgi:hypothetical protein
MYIEGGSLMGSLGKSNSSQVPPLVSRVEKIDSNTGPLIKAEIDAILELGWNLIDVFTKGNNTFAVFTRPKKQS